MEIRKYYVNFYDDYEENVFVKTDNGDKFELCLWTMISRYKGTATKNGVKIADGWNETVAIYHKLGAENIKPEKEFNAAEGEDGDEFEEELKIWLYGDEYISKEKAEEEEKAAKEAAKKEHEKREAAEAAKKADEEKARRATYGDEQDVAVLEVLYKALQQSKKPKMLINYASRFCPKFKSGRFEQPRTIIRAGGREYAFQFGEGWERIY